MRFLTIVYILAPSGTARQCLGQAQRRWPAAGQVPDLKSKRYVDAEAVANRGKTA